MKLTKLVLLIFLSTSLSGCSWLSSFFIVNKTSDKISITYSLNPTSKDDYSYALKDEINFNELNNEEKEDNIDLIGKYIEKEYSKEVIDGIEVYSVIIEPNTALCGGFNLPFFHYGQTDERHKIFENLLEMTIIRFDTKDTIVLSPTSIADFSRPLNPHHIALIFD